MSCDAMKSVLSRYMFIIGRKAKCNSLKPDKGMRKTSSDTHTVSSKFIWLNKEEREIHKGIIAKDELY